MKRIMMAGLALAMLLGSSGCVNNCRQCNGGRQSLFGGHHGHQGDPCRDGLCNRNGGRGGAGGAGAGGAGGAGGVGGAMVAYPYYTVRAPRDFLDSNPRGIGP
jgi:hypothetical protein